VQELRDLTKGMESETGNKYIINVQLTTTAAKCHDRNGINQSINESINWNVG